MLLSDFKLIEGNHFVAMEYYGLILNRTFLILLTDTYMLGAVANGLVSAQASGDPLTSIIIHSMAIHGDVQNPLSYVKEKYLRRLGSIDLLGEDFLEAHRANFRIAFSEIDEVSYNPRKKWGMGEYPHDGRVYVTVNWTKREFIILGDQSGEAIAIWIRKRTRKLT